MKPVSLKFSVKRSISTSREGSEVNLLSQSCDHQSFRLTPRENEVICCFANGLLYKETAEKLRISYSAVHKHQHKAFLKLRATNRSEAIRNWWDRGGK